MAEKKDPSLLPEGRLINAALFEKDTYVDEKGHEATPQYKVELVFDPAQVEGEGTIEDAVLEAIEAEWGSPAVDEYYDGKISSPFRSGDEIAADRAKRGKNGDAYVGKTVIRANTIYNGFGQDGPGGVQVFGPDAKALGVAQRDQIYPGCFGQAAVIASAYVVRGERGVKFYLCAFQKTKDGERLVSQRDHSTLFKPVGRTEGAAGAAPARRNRKG